MKTGILMLFLTLALTVPAHAVSIPEDLEYVIPMGAEDILELESLSPETGLADGLHRIMKAVQRKAQEILMSQTKNAVRILLVVLLCGLVDAGMTGKEEKTTAFLPMAGSLAIASLTLGSLDSLLGLGQETIHQLAAFAKVLLPIMAAATAAAGGFSSGTAHQLTAIFFVELLVQMIEVLLLPLLGGYTALLTAGSCLGEERLHALAEGIRKGATWCLCTAMVAFTGYLSAARILSGTTDAMSVKLTKAAISSAVPVVGSIISDAAESVLAGAGLLRGTLGLTGMLIVLAACAYPFLRLGIQYLLYKLTALLASVIGAQELGKLINGFGSVFGLVLGMTGSCALLLLISVLSCVSAVVP